MCDKLPTALLDPPASTGLHATTRAVPQRGRMIAAEIG
jgi:hypothetical protein